MKHEHQTILQIITQYLIDNPDQRFGQALFSLGINKFSNETNPAECNYLLKDIYNDTDKEILERINPSADGKKSK